MSLNNDNSIGNIEFVKFRDEFFDKLNSKSTWGKNEIKELFHITFENVINVNFDNHNKSFIDYLRSEH